ncbi:ABC transporter permease [Geobacillus zalihae]|uniref:ABC transporter permease n=1 Tax=Geobacillus zalihae TaxID=213419 RepID=A0A7H1RWF9_9BACL|nr:MULTISPECIES: ABC transporter permease [Geobacillus]EPR26190.1 Oligopeptide transport system permease protein oppB [Geobacillus sp. WSUCF1]OQP20723.1 peptide ABC transporter permease [Geobacillus zalihae]QNU18598.1 ABC transporter permease [Geobacillus zalihae]WKA48641.1 ABC transporter permease [Geobacillus zalihae]
MNFVVRRMFTFFLTLIFVVFLSFCAFRIIPGNPALAILGTEATPAQLEALNKKLGADKPLIEQFGSWMINVLHFDFGESLRFSEPVLSLIISRSSVTFSLAIIALIITVVTAIPLGMLAAKSKGKTMDFLISIITQIGLSVPSFWSGILLILIFGFTLNWFSAGGYVPWSKSPFLALRSLFLPSLAIAIPQIAIVVRYLRTTIIEQLNEDYVRTAYSKGLKESTIYFKHVLKNALIPVVTVVGMNFGEILAGSLVIEQVFTLPGFGSLLVSAIGSRDYPLIQGMVLIIAFLVVLVNLIVDLTYRWLDPKMELK